MLGHAGVLSFVHQAHLLQRQRRGRQYPVIALREKDEDVQENETNRKQKVEQNVLLAGFFAALGEFTNSYKLKIAPS